MLDIPDNEKWLASLAKKSASDDIQYGSSSSKNKKSRSARNASGSSASVDSSILMASPQHKQITTEASRLVTKADRILRRQEKRLKREECKRKFELKRESQLAEKVRKRGREDLKLVQSSVSDGSQNDAIMHYKLSRISNERRMSSASKRALRRISKDIFRAVTRFAQQSATLPTNQNTFNQKLFIESSKLNAKTVVNGIPLSLEGKATKRSTLRFSSSELQPRNRDYNGQGLVRPSLFLPLNDISFVPKLQQEFAEHIPGFFGKAKKMSGKKNSAEVMLWRKCLETKLERKSKENDLDRVKNKRKTMPGKIK